jgi:DNA-binding response OmpR family regulator
MSTIVIVDDDPGTLRLVARTLASAGHVPLCYESFDALRAALYRFRPAAFVLDVQIPYVDGLDICRWVRGLPEYARTPVLFLTSDTRPEAVAEALAAGGNDYLAKPIHPHLLLERLDRQIRRRAA